MKLAIAAGIAVILFIWFLASPPGELVRDVLGFIPGVIWRWIFGFGALAGVILLVVYIRRNA